MFRDIFAILFPLTDALRKQILDLAIHGAEIILRPGSELIKELFRQAQGNLFFLVFCHWKDLPLVGSPAGFVPAGRSCCLVQGTRIYYGLCVMVAAQNDKQIGDHCSLALFI